MANVMESLSKLGRLWIACQFSKSGFIFFSSTIPLSVKAKLERIFVCSPVKLTKSHVCLTHVKCGVA